MGHMIIVLDKKGEKFWIVLTFTTASLVAAKSFAVSFRFVGNAT